MTIIPVVLIIELIVFIAATNSKCKSNLPGCVDLILGELQTPFISTLTFYLIKCWNEISLPNFAGCFLENHPALLKDQFLKKKKKPVAFSAQIYSLK